MNFTETLLPGVGVRYDATTRAGVALSIVLDREGGAEVATYLREDPDAVDRCFRFSPHEAAAIADECRLLQTSACRLARGQPHALGTASWPCPVISSSACRWSVALGD